MREIDKEILKIELDFKDTLNSKKSGLPDADDFCG